VFAYDRDSRTPVWQSGTSVAISDAKNVWVLGAGPFQRGTIYNGTRFAGSRLPNPLAQSKRRQGVIVGETVAADEPGAITYTESYTFIEEESETEPENDGLQPADPEVRLSEFAEPMREGAEAEPVPAGE
jgi:hypothetical protein